MIRPKIRLDTLALPVVIAAPVLVLIVQRRREAVLE